jgi:hypothetical protein
MPVRQPNLAARGVLQILAPPRDIDVFCQTPGVRFHLLHVQVSRQPADDPLLQPCRRENPLHQPGQIEKSFRALLEKRIDDNHHNASPRLSHSRGPKARRAKLLANS